jgi:hypothetical protein
MIMNRFVLSHFTVWQEAVGYFGQLGFVKPPNYSDAEFLASVVEKPALFLADLECTPVSHCWAMQLFLWMWL